MLITWQTVPMFATWSEVFLYGVYTRLFFKMAYMIQKRGSARSFSARVFNWSGVCMFMLATFHVAVSIHRMVNGYVWSLANAGSTAYFSDYETWDLLAQTISILIMTLMGDILMTYRCYIIWNGNYLVIIVPGILLFASIGVNIVALYYFTHPFAIPLPTVMKVLSCIYPLAFAQNLSATTIIILRILQQHNASKAAGLKQYDSRFSLRNVARILVESAMMYTGAMLGLIILFFVGSPLQLVIQNSNMPIIGIAFTLIAVRINHVSVLRNDTGIVTTALPPWAEPGTISVVGPTNDIRESKAKQFSADV